MPRCLEPGQEFDVELESPHGTRKFTFRSVSVRRTIELRKRISTDAASGIAEFLKSVVTGWENVKDENGEDVAFAPEKLLDVVSESGLCDLYRGFSLSGDDKKKSE